MLLLAENATCYQNLLKIASAAQLEGFYYFPRIDREFLAAVRVTPLAFWRDCAARAADATARIFGSASPSVRRPQLCRAVRAAGTPRSRSVQAVRLHVAPGPRAAGSTPLLPRRVTSISRQVATEGFRGLVRASK